MLRVAVAAVVAAFALPAAGAHSGAPLPLVAFVHGGDIWAVGVDGRGARDLTRTPSVNESSPSWSPDGMQLAYLRGAEVWEMHADGGDPHLVVSGPPAGFASYVESAGVNWSSTGRIAYVTWDSQLHQPELVVANADGTGAQPLALDPNPPGEHRTPWYDDLVWSPDGARLYFALDDIDNRYGIFSIAPDGTGFAQLAGTSAGYVGLAFSRAGSRLVYTRPHGGIGPIAYLDLRLAKANGAKPEWLTKAPGDDISGSWSRDSQRVVFASQRGAKPLRLNSPLDLYVIDVRTDSVHRLLHLTGSESDPQWQPG
jgi:Tol biopolymer transport system component